MKKMYYGLLISSILLLYVSKVSVAMSCHSSGGGHEEHSAKTEAKKADDSAGIGIKESFLTTVYVCPMHPEVKRETRGKCPKCGMNLERTKVVMAYVCPEKDCEYQKANPGQCPEHKKDLIKCEIKYHCPKCGEQVNSEDLKLKPVKP